MLQFMFGTHASGIMHLARASVPQLAAVAAARHVQSSAAAAGLQQRQIRSPASELYMNGLMFMQQPWKAVLVDAAGERAWALPVQPQAVQLPRTACQMEPLHCWHSMSHI
jgi:hypothetical protein